MGAQRTTLVLGRCDWCGEEINEYNKNDHRVAPGAKPLCRQRQELLQETSSAEAQKRRRGKRRRRIRPDSR